MGGFSKKWCVADIITDTLRCDKSNQPILVQHIVGSVIQMKSLSESEIEQGLQSKSVSTRSEVVRHYEYFGTLEDLPRLIDLASTDASISVRNIAADAISDILSRHRVGSAKALLSLEQREALLKSFRKIRASKTPVVFLSYASLGIPTVFQMLLSSFMDPRAEFQNYAAAGFRCFCLSSDVLDDESIEDALIALLHDEKLDVPRIAHVVRLCAEAGYTKVLPFLPSLPEQDALIEIALATQDHLQSTSHRPVGMWFSNGLDALEFNPESTSIGKFLLVTETSVFIEEGGVWTEHPDFLNQPKRRLFFRPIGQEDSTHAIQTKTDTWVAIQNGELQSLLQQETQFDLPSNPLLAHLAGWLESRVQDNAKNTRLLALLWMRAEQWAICEQYVNKGLSYKKISHDLFFVQARCLFARGLHTQALDALEKCLALSKSEQSVVAKQCELLKMQIQSVG